MAWPERPDLWGENLPRAQHAYARVAQAIASFEPITMIASSSCVSQAAKLCGPGVDTLALPIDDAWLRDTGPAFLVHEDGARAASAWHFNGWGGSFSRFENDAALATRLCDHLGLPLRQTDLRLEGGAISVDGEGTILTTESCVLNPNRNPSMTRLEAERELCHALGAKKVIWLPGELSEEDCTDGHIDGLACFARPGLVLLETLTDPASERSKLLRENRNALRGMTDARGVEPARQILEQAFPSRKVVQVDVRDIAIGGGGIHCITQQQPV